ncbi:hypothetical protein JN11_02723 [Mucilaginibacter frigoritolerans]|uniref:DUF3887 domain-containing protein n=1 Tax=Mucilaginibacter frigoritolerans TaxID=652788 RepID=A0A562U277_9SPHI|nr:hypothetical protein [Mucilaginibacter frigoritolerans]TWI99406.1 hypothetical protein JN11_02723 [Mucilaginibacter frigoritolerans]
MKKINTKRFFFGLILMTGIICSLYDANAQTATPAKPVTAKPAVAKAPAVKSATAIIDTFFKKYKDDGTSPAIDYLFATNKLFTDSVQIGVLKGKLDALRQSVGTYTGKELIAQKIAAPSLVFYSYLVKHEKSPIRFTFMFYKPKNEWVLYRFKYDDQMDTELEDAGKINNKH